MLKQFNLKKIRIRKLKEKIGYSLRRLRELSGEEGLIRSKQAKITPDDQPKFIMSPQTIQ